MNRMITRAAVLTVGIGVLISGGCANRPVRTEPVADEPAQQSASEQTEPGALPTGASAKAEQAGALKVDEKSLARARKDAQQSGRSQGASAEYHFAMAQAYVASGNSERAIEEYKLALIFDPSSALLYARLASEYIKKGMLSAAMETCKQALEREPDFVDARLLLAGLYSTARETDLAIAEYDRVLKAKPGHEEAVIYKAQALLEDGRVGEAGAELRRFIRRNAESALAFYYLGRAEQRAQKFDDAIRAFKKAMELRPGFSQAAMAMGYLFEERKQNDKALGVYKRLYDETQDMGAANRMATIYLKEEKYKEAMPYLEAVQSTDPDDMNVRVKLGLVQMELKQYEKAIATFKEILAKNPDSDRIHYYLGSLYEETQRNDLAISELKKIQPDSKLYTDASLHVAYLLKQAGKAEEAKRFMKQAIVKAPRTPGFYLFQASMEEESKDIAGAVEVLESAVEMFPEDEKVRYYLGSLHDRKGNTDQAITHMEAILRVNPDNVDALNYIGYTWTTKGIRLSDAEQLLRRALKLKPDNGYIQDSWGWYLFVRGRTHEAVVELEKAARMKPNEPTILEHLGDVYIRLNLRHKALEQYREAAKYSDDESNRKKLESKVAELHREINGSTPETQLAEPMPAMTTPAERLPAGR